MRRNPVIADLFHRMKYMERRGSGLRNIVSETEKLPGYTEAYKPEFSSTATDFRVIFKNVNYNLEGDATKLPTKILNYQRCPNRFWLFAQHQNPRKSLQYFAASKI